MRTLLAASLLAIGLGIGAADAQVIVTVRPPRPLVERRIPRPGPGYVWVPGFHRWDGRAYVWVPGRWDMPPRPRAAWVPGHWARRGHGWIFIEGHWR